MLHTCAVTICYKSTVIADSLRVSDVNTCADTSCPGCKFWGKSTVIVSLPDSLRVSDVTYLCCYNLSRL